MLGFAFLASLFSPPAFGAGVTVRLVGEPEGFDESVRPWMQAVRGFLILQFIFRI
jgi:hypothetical protein